MVAEIFEFPSYKSVRLVVSDGNSFGVSEEGPMIPLVSRS